MKVILISTVPIISAIKKFNDLHICLIVSEQADIKSLYPKGAIRFEFTRTQS